MWDVLNSESEPVTGCWWPIIDNCDCSVPPEIATAADQMAADVLWALSGRRFGVCTMIERPCIDTRCDYSFLTGDAATYWASLQLPWSWSVVSCGRCRRNRCSCSNVDALTINHDNVRSITEIVIDGVTLDPSAYRLSGNRVIRRDGGAWPTCQDERADLFEDGSWHWAVRVGIPLPYGGRVATGVLSCEIAKALVGAEDCQLPERVQTITRDGVTIGFVDPMDYLDNGKTGLHIVDMWLSAVNPGGLRQAPGLLSADSY